MFKKCVLSLLVVFICTSVQAGTLSPKETLEYKIDEIFAILDSQSNGESERQAALKFISESFCLKSMSKFVLKEKWENLNEEEKEKFADHLSGLIFNFYFPTIKNYKGCEIKYLKTSGDQNEKCFIHTRTSKKGKNTDIIYSMILKNEAWVIYDVKIQGVSMLRNYQAQFEKRKNKNIHAMLSPS